MAMSFGTRAAGEAVNAMNSILGAPTADNTMLTRAGRMAQDLQERTKYTTDSQEEIEKEKADTNAKLIGMAADSASAIQGINQNAAGITGLLDAGTSLLGTFGGDIFGGGAAAATAPVGIGDGVGQASLTPGIDVRSDFSNKINPIAGFGGVLNAQ